MPASSPCSSSGCCSTRSGGAASVAPPARTPAASPGRPRPPGSPPSSAPRWRNMPSRSSRLRGMDQAVEPRQAVERRYRGRLPDERRAERRRRLLGAGLELFGTVGYHGTSIERLCAQAGVNPELERTRQEALHGFARITQAEIERQADAGVIARRDYHLAALVAAGGTRELLMEWVSGDRNPPLEELIQELTRIFVAIA